MSYNRLIQSKMFRNKYLWRRAIHPPLKRGRISCDALKIISLEYLPALTGLSIGSICRINSLEPEYALTIAAVTILPNIYLLFSIPARNSLTKRNNHAIVGYLLGTLTPYADKIYNAFLS